MERYYDIVYHFDTVLGILLQALCLAVWVRPFAPRGRKVWPVAAVYASLTVFFYFIPYYMSMMGTTVLSLLVVLLMCCAADREYIGQKIWLAMVFACFRWQTASVFSSLNTLVYGLMCRLLYDRETIVWFRYFVINYFLLAVLESAFLYGAVKLMHRCYGRKREQVNGGEFILLVIPALVGLAAYGLLHYYNALYQKNTGGDITDLGAAHEWIKIGYLLFLMAVIMAMGYLFRQWKNEKDEELRRRILFRQMEDLEEHIAAAEQHYRDMQSLRHDMAGHLMTLEELYAAGRHEAARQYAQTLRDKTRDTLPLLQSGNPVTDVILSEKKREMEQKGIAFDCAFHYPARRQAAHGEKQQPTQPESAQTPHGAEKQPTQQERTQAPHGAGEQSTQDERQRAAREMRVTEPVNTFDISVILNNGLNNAMEAAEQIKNAHVSLSSRLIGKMFLMEIVNDCAGQCRIDPATGLPPSTKQGEGHGYGLLNIRSVAHKYLGDMEAGTEERGGRTCFVLRVMLQI